MDRIAHVVISHRNPAQVDRLVRRLADGRNLVIVHHDPTGERWPCPRVAGAEHVVFLSATPVVWGHWSHVEALLRSFEYVLNTPDVEWVFVHSGQDYPLASNDAIQELVQDAKCDGFLAMRSVPFPPRYGLATNQESEEFIYRSYRYFKIPAFFASRRIPPAVRRVMKRCSVSINARQRTVRFSINGFWGRPVIGFRTSDRWLNGQVMHKSSDWMILRRTAITAIVDATTDKHFMRRYSRTLCPTESFFATILANRDDMNLRDRDYRFIRWQGGPHPAVLTTADLEEMVASGDLFARKFDAGVDGRVLDLVDNYIDAGQMSPP